MSVTVYLIFITFVICFWFPSSCFPFVGCSSLPQDSNQTHCTLGFRKGLLKQKTGEMLAWLWHLAFRWSVDTLCLKNLWKSKLFSTPQWTQRYWECGKWKNHIKREKCSDVWYLWFSEKPQISVDLSRNRTTGWRYNWRFQSRLAFPYHPFVEFDGFHSWAPYQGTYIHMVELEVVLLAETTNIVFTFLDICVLDFWGCVYSLCST